jgi:hypothetical protein
MFSSTLKNTNSAGVVAENSKVVGLAPEITNFPNLGNTTWLSPNTCGGHLTYVRIGSNRVGISFDILEAGNLVFDIAT